MTSRVRKSAFIKKALAKLPGYANADTFFYAIPFEHILSGFCCELTPRGAYVWRFTYPLFDRFVDLHLTYSYRLPGAERYIDFTKIPRENLADEFVRRIEGLLEEARQCVTISQFVEFLENQEGLGNGHIQKVLGYSKVLLGQKKQALQHLHKAIEGLREPSAGECRMISELIENDFEMAKEKILGFEAEMRITVGIS